MRAFEDVGPAGADKGAGGKYLILPPDHEGEVPGGYISLRAQTYQGYALLRSDVRSGSDADVAAAVAYGKTIRFYPLSQAATPGETHFLDFDGKPYEANIPFDRRYFRSLAQMIDYEPWLERDKTMSDPLRSLGIEKASPLRPTPSPKRPSITQRSKPRRGSTPSASECSIHLFTRGRAGRCRPTMP